jgi:hypothetical protein
MLLKQAGPDPSFVKLAVLHDETTCRKNGLWFSNRIFFHPSLLLLFMDPGSEMGKNQDPGSWINIPDPQHWCYIIGTGII